MWQGCSLIDGSPIALIAVGLETSSENSKTGGMVQTYILPTTLPPHKAVQTGQDFAVCGDCPHRPSNQTAPSKCYVRTFQGPNQVFRSWKAGNYPTWSSLSAKARMRATLLMQAKGIRLGAWGNPSAVPQHAWERLPIRSTLTRTGYDHGWRDPRAVWLKGLVQASVSSFAEAKEAETLGWSPYLHLREPPSRPPKGWTRCPENLSKLVTCSTCGLCDGSKKIYAGATQTKHHWRNQ